MTQSSNKAHLSLHLDDVSPVPQPWALCLMLSSSLKLWEGRNLAKWPRTPPQVRMGSHPGSFTYAVTLNKKSPSRATRNSSMQWGNELCNGISCLSIVRLEMTCVTQGMQHHWWVLFLFCHFQWSCALFFFIKFPTPIPIFHEIFRQAPSIHNYRRDDAISSVSQLQQSCLCIAASCS